MALYGRSACRQGAHLALTRQLSSVRAALPTGAMIVDCFADVCAWNGWAETSCADPSICTGWVLDTHTIEGGLATVLRRARRPVSDFEVLACEDTDRLSRRTFRRTLIEDALEACVWASCSPSTVRADSFNSPLNRPARETRSVGPLVDRKG